MKFDPRFLAGVLAMISLTCFQATGAAEPAPSRVVSCKLIRNAADLQDMNLNLARSYCLAKDIDAGSIANFVPIGVDSGTAFTGKFFGNNRIISNLKINSDALNVGLFGYASGAVIRDVGLVNVDVTGTLTGANVGGLVGTASGGAPISRVYVTGQVSCTAVCSQTGGIAGNLTGGGTFADSWSSAKVSAIGGYTGGAVGYNDNRIIRSYATGHVDCSVGCNIGGLAGINNGWVGLSFATGPVTGGNSARAGGLIGYGYGNIAQSYATGPVSGASSAAYVGGLIGYSDGGINQSYATGPVNGGGGSTVGGLVGLSNGGVYESYAVGPVSAGAGSTVGGLSGAGFGATNSYWDKNTSGTIVSAAGTGRTTAQLRFILPIGFTNAWAISRNLSYPFLDDFDIDFASPLATLVRSNKIFTFLPIGQLDKSLYTGATAHIDAASQAAVYTMIARAIGLTKNVAPLKEVKISYFWDDATQTTKPWTAPEATHATLGPLTIIAAATPIGNNVVAPMNLQKLVILRGTYTKSGGGTAKHWMLGTMYTKNPDNTLSTVVANDPLTGAQLEIDPVSKKVLSPPNFPLSDFKVNFFRTVTIN